MGCSDFGPEISGRLLESFRQEFGDQPYLENGLWMAQMADFRTKKEGKSWCRIPFSNTIENQGLKYSSIENFVDTPPIQSVLEAADYLHQMKKPVCLQITGAVTVMMEFMGSRDMIRCYKKRQEEFWNIMDEIVQALVDYTQKAIELGVEMISYGDPSGTAQIMGPDFFHKVTGVAVRKFCRRIQSMRTGCVIHLCPQLTSALLQDCQLILVEKRLQAESSYGEMLFEMAKDSKKVWLVGDYCVKQEKSIVQSVSIYKWSDYRPEHTLQEEEE